MTKVAIIQEAPVFLDRTKTIEKAVKLVEKAAKENAKLVVFSEAFIPGYPAWIWRLKPGGDWGTSEQFHARLLDNSVDLSSNQLDPLLAAAKKHNLTISCGINERDDANSRTTIFNTNIIIGPDGTIFNRHRKLMPTNPERMVWGFGDASGLKVVDTPAGRVGSLICWENFMPLARYALYSQAIDVYIAPTYDTGDGWIGTLQHIAREGCCWVIGAGTVLNASDLPDDLPDGERIYPDKTEWINSGDSVIIAPGGDIVAGPMRQETGLLIADIDLSKVSSSRRSLDIAGHYSRPDIFTLNVDNKPQSTTEFTN